MWHTSICHLLQHITKNPENTQEIQNSKFRIELLVNSKFRNGVLNSKWQLVNSNFKLTQCLVHISLLQFKIPFVNSKFQIQALLSFYLHFVFYGCDFQNLNSCTNFHALLIFGLLLLLLINLCCFPCLSLLPSTSGDLASFETG